MNFKKFLNEELHDPSILKVIFLAGSPGSGKTFISDKVTSGLGFKKLNIDDILEHRFTKKNITMDFSKLSSNFVNKEHDIAREKTSKRKDIWTNGRLGLVIDGTGKNFDVIKSQVDEFKELGYDEMMIFVNVSLETSLKRNEMRDRKVEVSLVKDFWNRTQVNIDKYKQLFGSKFILIDNENLDDEYIKGIWKKIRNFSRSKVENIIGKNWISQRKDSRK